MGAKGEALAKQFEAKAQEAATVLEKLSDADWKKVTEAEKWSVGVTAHHLAGSYDRVPDIAAGLAAGQSFGNFTRKILDERNAQHAKDFAGCTKEETLALHRKGAGEGRFRGPRVQRRAAGNEGGPLYGRPADDGGAADHGGPHRPHRRTLRQHPEDGGQVIAVPSAPEGPGVRVRSRSTRERIG
jgi:hypothetical protein